MSFSNWFAFFVAAWIIALSPGSGAVLSMAHGINYGVKKTSATILGLQLGLLLILSIAGAGVGSILMASASAFMLVKVLGAAYLIYLGVVQWRARSQLNLTGLTGQAKIPGVRQRIVTGFLTNATNPKGILFMVAVFPQFIDSSKPLLAQLLILGATMTSIDLCVMHSYAFAAASLQRYLNSPVWARRQNRFFGGLLILMGAGLFFMKQGGKSA